MKRKTLVILAVLALGAPAMAGKKRQGCPETLARGVGPQFLVPSDADTLGGGNRGGGRSARLDDASVYRDANQNRTYDAAGSYNDSGGHGGGALSSP